MALNKYMHPRNIYRTPPDFEKLSKLHPDFSKIAKMDVTGKVTIDFKDPHSLRVLTKCLFKSDFSLDVEIPEDRLVPTLPLRLNYILWVEDLMIAIQRTSQVRGIDIGTGACAVYPLLAAVKNKWYMLATETDPLSLQKAQENIQRNNLQQLIELRNNKGTMLIENLFSGEIKDKYDFCMCNPPFYSNLQELYESRSPARLPPKNGFTGSPQELITEGGELKFCRILIAESKRCKDHVLIFTTMVGHKYNLSMLLLDLKAEGIKHTHTEFCQGRVTRWGLAWTYQDHDIYRLVSPRDKPRKKIAPLSHLLPPIPNCEYNMETTYSKIKAILSSLQIEQKILNKCGNRISMDISAKENMWSNQRRKRRLLKKMETTDAKKLKSDTDEAINVEPSVSNAKNTEVNMLKSNVAGSTTENSEKRTETTDTKVSKSQTDESNDVELSMNTPQKIDNTNKIKSDGDESIDETSDKRTKIVSVNVSNSAVVGSGIKTSKSNQETVNNKVNSFENKPTNGETSTANTDNSIKSHKSAENTENIATTEPLIHAFLKLYKKDNTIQLEIEFIDGTGGKESVYQVIQYIKNNWKYFFVL